MKTPARVWLVLCFLVEATVVRVIDGDTFEARLRVFLDEERIVRVRVLGVDAVELRELRGSCRSSSPSTRRPASGSSGRARTG